MELAGLGGAPQIAAALEQGARLGAPMEALCDLLEELKGMLARLSDNAKVPPK